MTDEFPQQKDGTFHWRLRAIEKAVDKLDQEKAEAKEVARIADELVTLRRALIVFSLSMVGTGGLFLLGVLTLVRNSAP